MALIRCDFFSDVLEMSTSMTVVLPQPTIAQIGMDGAVDGGPPPVLYLLHGLSDDDSTWVRRTSIERYVAALGLAVVMPAGHRGFYLDGVHTGRYSRFLSDELPRTVHRFFRLSRRPQDTFVAGLSMGGYGALRWALRAPDRFGAAASLSGALDVARDVAGGVASSSHPGLWRAVLGESAQRVGPDADLWTLLDRSDPAAVPPLYLACGSEDELLRHSERFRDAAAARGVEVTWCSSPGGHEWSYWDRAIQDVLAWLPLDTPSQGSQGSQD